MILIDTNIIIELLKGSSKVISKMELISKEEICISVVTYAELIFGSRNKVEQIKLEKKLNELNIINIDIEISEIFKNLMKNYSLSHRLNIPDSLIASTSIATKSKLFTLNKKNFKYIPEIEFIDFE